MAFKICYMKNARELSFWATCGQVIQKRRQDVKLVNEDSHDKRKREDEVVIQQSVCLSHLNCTGKGIFWQHEVAKF